MRLALLVLLSLPSRAGADDGVVEINQARAEAGGVTPGDTALFPVTLSQPGSYRLTGNLTVATANVTAILITSVDVSLDLNGFAIQGPVTCTGEPVSGCPSGSGRGIDASATSRTTVRNGIVKGFGSDGLLLGQLSRVKDVHARSNGGNGISIGRLSQVSSCIVESNGVAGIGSSGAHILVEGSSAFFNASSGFSLGAYSNVRGSTAFTNGFQGIEFGGLGAFEGNTLNANQGFEVGGNAKATGGNLCSDGTCSVRGARRFYLTLSMADGANALNECAQGFHMASFNEIREITSLEYAAAYGFTRDDSGQGPPTSAGGWVRTGFVESTSGPVGIANCMAWTSSTLTDDGTIVSLMPEWDKALSVLTNYWEANTNPCSTTLRVWCVED